MLSWTGQQKCTQDGKFFKVELVDSNYLFEEIENFLIPTKSNHGEKVHIDLDDKVINTCFFYLVDDKEVVENVKVEFQHLPDSCDIDTCWYETEIKRPINHKKVKNDGYTWQKCTFYFELKDLENVDLLNKYLPISREIKVLVSSSHQDN